MMRRSGFVLSVLVLLGAASAWAQVVPCLPSAANPIRPGAVLFPVSPYTEVSVQLRDAAGNIRAPTNAVTTKQALDPVQLLGLLNEAATTQSTPVLVSSGLPAPAPAMSCFQTVTVDMNYAPCNPGSVQLNNGDVFQPPPNHTYLRTVVQPTTSP